MEQEWQKVDAAHMHDDLDWVVGEGEDSEEWECVACRKNFRSEAAWDSHERSKKHMKEVERLRSEMLEQNEEFGLDGEEAEEQGEEDQEEGEEQGEEQEQEEQKTGTEERNEELEVLDPSPSIPYPAVVPVIPVDEPPISLPSSAENIESEGNQTLSRRDKKSNKNSFKARTIPAPPMKAQRKGEIIPQSEKLRSDKLEPQRGSSDLAGILDGAATEDSGLTHKGSLLEKNDDARQQVPDHPDQNMATELTKREKRRARQAKKAEAGETPVSEVTHLHLSLYLIMYRMNSDIGL